MKPAQSIHQPAAMTQLPYRGQLVKTWMLWAVFFFLVASLFGLAMRYFYIGELAFFEYKNLLHAHSHLALLGWGYLFLSGILAFTFISDEGRLRYYKKLLLLTVVANLGMMVSFPFQGYGLFSISFSTMHLLVSYVFAFSFLQDLKKSPKTPATSLIKWGLYWMVLSTLGLWAIGPVAALLSKTHPLYSMSIQWFLHLQLNGWFVYTLFGLLTHHLQGYTQSVQSIKILIGSLHVSMLLTYALAVSWSIAHPALYYLNAGGVMIQAVVYFHFIKPIWQNLRLGEKWIQMLLILALTSLIAKAVIQLALVIPEVSIVAYTIRMYVIGFLHLVMLGGMSLGLAALALEKEWLPKAKLSKLGWILLSVGFLLTELLLLGQGTMLWLHVGFMPHYYSLLFISSLLFPLGLSCIGSDIMGQQIQLPKVTKLQIFLRSQFSIKHNSMKKSILLSLGVMLLLMGSCGGSGEKQTDGTASKPVSAEKTADPKGIGPVRSVDLQDAIDEAMANKGKALMDMKCTACHQYNDKRIVGPGFEGITNRRRPEWIMNMITNVEVMLDQDPVAQALLEECLTRMPNQNISQDEARQILEHLRKNDFERTGSKDAASK
jgi:hypothetical protein